MSAQMSINAIATALEFAPAVKTRHGGDGGMRSMLATLIEALSAGRLAEAEYRRQVARGVDPATAASEAFRRYQDVA